MFNLRIAFLATSVCWLAFTLADLDAGSGTNASSTLNCERGTYDDAEGNCKQCKDFLDSCKSDEECCVREVLQCYQGVCGCKLETSWSQFDKECLLRATPTFPAEIEDQINTTILVASIVGGIFVLIVLLLIIYAIVRAYKIYKLEQARASGQDVRSAAFRPSAHPPPPPPGTVVWNNGPAHNQQQRYQQPYPHAKAHVMPPHSLFPRRSSTGSASAPPEEVFYDRYDDQPSQSQDTDFSPPSYPSYESAATME